MIISPLIYIAWKTINVISTSRVNPYDAGTLYPFSFKQFQTKKFNLNC